MLSAGPERLDAVIRSRIPYVGSCGALDMVNFWAMETVPAQFRQRKLHRHNQNVTLMRTTAEENGAIGRFIAEKLNRMEGPVRFLIPEGGVSLLDAPEQPFWDPAADQALFDAIAQRTPRHRQPPADPPAIQHQRSRLCRGGGCRLRRAHAPATRRRPPPTPVTRGSWPASRARTY